MRNACQPKRKHHAQSNDESVSHKAPPIKFSVAHNFLIFYFANKIEVG
jgi:hypothetical protein